jgi:hypothetical protein
MGNAMGQMPSAGRAKQYATNGAAAMAASPPHRRKASQGCRTPRKSSSSKTGAFTTTKNTINKNSTSLGFSVASNTMG